MAADYIKIIRTDTAAVQATTLISAIQQVRNAVTALQQVKDIADHNFATTNFTAFEALFGVPTGSGQTVYDLINGSLGAMKGTFQNTNSIELISRVG